MNQISHVPALSTMNHFLISSLLVYTVWSVVSPMANAEVCRRMKASADPEVFECPRIFESKYKTWCCHSNTLDPFCCDWSSRAKEAGFNTFYWHEGLLTRMVVLFIIMLICLLLLCYLLRSMRCISKNRANVQRLHSRPRLDSLSNAVPMAPPSPSMYYDPPPSYQEATTPVVEANATAPNEYPKLTDQNQSSPAVTGNNNNNLISQAQPPFNPKFINPESGNKPSNLSI